ncbi:MAG: 16S rRNA (guanine(966)-N(2))-methyltransferase RsmD [Proteobacteria bacterium]|nr:16S rRNA (guanine(966)-N(2))-methyltransferase RsmD [Pseudomonadota bacterium]
MRIIAGEHRGRKLFSPPDRSIRPTGDKVREAIFSILAGAQQDARVLDLFAGTGAMGLEALSRGAAFALFADASPKARDLIMKNLQALGLSGRARLVLTDLAQDLVFLQGQEPFDLVFCDPPYQAGLAPAVLSALAASGVLAPDAVVVLEHGPEEKSLEAPAPLALTDQRRYGKTLVSFFGLVI